MLLPWEGSQLDAISQRVRGSQFLNGFKVKLMGSIPACAGEPWPTIESCWWTRVHPRVCGGAIARSPPAFIRQGPSPRVRGSRKLIHRHVYQRRSIPACAGEPFLDAYFSTQLWVHPRVCGGAFRILLDKAEAGGPSPRVRGSLSVCDPHSFTPGSIPACAGV
jgi:hypothetical protein